MSATTVLPEPTSPWRSRCIGAGRAMSSAICAMAEAWSSVSGNGSAAWNAGTSAPSVTCSIPVASAASARLRATSASCMRRNSSNFSRLAAPYRSAMVSGRWMLRYALPRSTRPSAARSRSSSGSAKPRAFVRSRHDATARRSCHVCTSAFPDCGYTGTMVPVTSEPASGSASTSTTGLVIWRFPR